MAAVKEALALATEVSTMLDCMITEKFGACETVMDFMDWAIQEHAEHVAEQIGIDRAGINDLLQWADDAIGDIDSLGVALPLFRYYLQVYKANRNLTDEQIDQLAIINKARIQVVGAATFISGLSKRKPSPEHSTNCPECSAL